VTQSLVIGIEPLDGLPHSETGIFQDAKSTRKGWKWFTIHDQVSRKLLYSVTVYEEDLALFD
jgi:hypothetical protein